jgi:hypothetical protein
MRSFLTLALAAGLLGSAGCGTVIAFKTKDGAAAGGAVSTAAPVKYEDFEAGAKGTYGFGNTAAGGNAKVFEDSQEFHSGTKALRVEYTTGNGNWGCGYGFGSNYQPADGFFNAKGTRGIELWAKAPVGLNFNFMVKEGKKGGGDDEVYLSSDITGTGRWKKYFIGWDQFTRSIYSGNQSGDDTLETGSIASMEGQLREKQGDGSLYLDDIYFK